MGTELEEANGDLGGGADAPAETANVTDGAGGIDDEGSNGPTDDEAGVGREPAGNEHVDMDQLLAGSDHGVGFLKEFDDLNADTFSVRPEELNDLSEAGKKTVHNLRRGFQKRMDAVATRDKALREREEELARREEALKGQGSDVLDMLRNLDLGDLTKEPAEGEVPPEPWEAGYPEWAAKKAIAAQLRGWKEAIGTAAEQREQAAKEREQARAAEVRVTEIESFAKANPDFDDYIPRIKEYQSKYGAVPAEDVYYSLKRQDKAAGEARLNARRNETRRARPAAGGKPTLQRPPAGLTPRQVHQWWEDHPEAAAAMAAKLRH